MKSNLGDKARLLHIKDSIDEIQNAIGNKSFDEFVNNHVLRIAIVKWLEIIGEASNNISGETISKAQNIEWKNIIGMRNFVVHEYFGINYDIIWKTVHSELGDLKKTVEIVIKDFE
ncbi:DUF86 domain-containing protein [Parafilimonas sp.]|uniref:HepT-like ribonuclease domain-containing protein n=1 Tax=Parafilimonas sp. TaxID=1969739 RepID=UPI0039E4EDC4